MDLTDLAMLAEFSKIAVVKKKRRRRRGLIRRATEPVRKPFREAMTYGFGGSLVGPGIAAIHRQIEQGGKAPKGVRFYSIGGKKVPSWIPASALSGFLGGGVLPYLKEIHRDKRKLKIKTAQGHGAILRRAPHLRGLKPAIIPESTKSHAKKLIQTSAGSGRLRAGEYRT